MNQDTLFATTSGKFATARRGALDLSEVDFIRAHLGRKVPVRHIAAMLRRPLSDVQPWVEEARKPPPEPEPEAFVPVVPRRPSVVLSLWRGLLPVPVTMDGIARDVAAKHGLTLEQLRGRSRKRRIAHPRQEAMWRMMETERWSTIRVGRYFDRDHSTVIHACQVHAKRVAVLLAEAA